MPNLLSPLNALSALGALFLSWLTPSLQISYLRERKDFQGWEYFRDGLVRRWTNSNIMVLSTGLRTAHFADGLSYSPVRFDNGASIKYRSFDLARFADWT